MNNKNNLEIGDVIEVQQAWEDEMGNHHDEFPTVLSVSADGRLGLDFGDNQLNDFLDGADFFANDYEVQK